MTNISTSIHVAFGFPTDFTVEFALDQLNTLQQVVEHGPDIPFQVLDDRPLEIAGDDSLAVIRSVESSPPNTMAVVQKHAGQETRILIRKDISLRFAFFVLTETVNNFLSETVNNLPESEAD